MFLGLPGPDHRSGSDIFTTLGSTRHRLRPLAQRSGVTLNDLMNHDLYLTIADWNGIASRRWMRITIPTNLRLEEDAVMPATNVLGFAFLERRLGRDHDSQVLLRSIHEQMAAVKRGRLGLLFIAGLKIV